MSSKELVFQYELFRGYHSSLLKYGIANVLFDIHECRAWHDNANKVKYVLLYAHLYDHVTT